MSTKKIETSHVGSLPRSMELAEMLIARDHGKQTDNAQFDRLVESEIETAINNQIDAGVSIVSDGELGKVGYSTYMTERLSGFGDAHIARKPARDLANHPDLAKKLSAIMGSQEFVRAACIDKVELINLEPLHDDIRRFKTALGAVGKPTKAFMNSASPGLITAFQPNHYYPSHDAYLADLVEAMRAEYEESEADLHAAYEEALQSGGDRLAARVALALVQTAGVKRRRLDVAEAWATSARALWSTMPTTPPAFSALNHAWGTVPPWRSQLWAFRKSRIRSTELASAMVEVPSLRLLICTAP